MKKVYVIMMQIDTFIGKAIRFFTREEFNHASICLTEKFDKFYSFGRIIINNPLAGGFVIENAFTHILRKIRKCSMYDIKKRSYG